MILFLSPYFEQKPWAGDTLNKLYDCKESTGEAWIVSGYNGKSSVIKNSKYKGQTLRHLWVKHPELFGDFDEKEFPILIKLISSKEDLSIQVHPSDQYALNKHNSLGKFECWYILDETTSKDIIIGVDASNQKEVKSYIENNILEEKLIKRNIKKDDLIIIEPGTLHAIKANTFLLEIQESSDITYRLYDYNRLPKRQLHIEDSLNVLKFNDKKNPIYDFSNSQIYESKYFDIEKINLNNEINLKNDTYRILYVLDGKLKVNNETLEKNDVVLITKDTLDIKLTGEANLIYVTPKYKEDRLKMRKIALITGIASQDGSYLAELLLDKGYEVHGIVNSKRLINLGYFSDELINNENLFFHLGDMTDSSGLNRLIENIKPDEIYHLAQQSHVEASFEMPEYTADVNSLGTIRLLDAIKQSELKVKLFNASTSLLYDGLVSPQTEETPFNPLTPYATSKLYAHYIVKNYRETYGIYAVNGIMFNHSSIKEDEGFVGKKIIKAVANVKNGHNTVLKIGNLYASRDWGYAPDYVLGMWKSLQMEKPDDYIFSTNETHTIKEFIDCAFSLIGIDLVWENEGLDEVAYDKSTKRLLVQVDPKFYRISETTHLQGDNTKALKILDWKPQTSFKELIKIMLESELNV